MSTETIPTKNSTDDIDLLDLFSKIVRGIKLFFIGLYNLAVKFFILIIQFFLYLAKKSLWVIVFCVVGAVIGFVQFSYSKRFFTSEMIAFSNSIENKYIVSAINLLNDPISAGKGNFHVVAEYLNMPESSVELLKSIKSGYGIDTDFDGIVDKVDYDNTFNALDSTGVKIKGIFYVQLEVYDESIMEKVQAGILNYIYKNKYLSDMNRTRIEQQRQRINNIDIEIKKLDSLQQIMYFETPKLKSTIPSDKLVFMNEIEQKLYHAEILELKQKKLEIQREIEVRGDAITILQPFTPTAASANPLLSYIIKWVVIFFVLSLIASILWEYRKVIWRILFDKQESESAIKGLDTLLRIKKEE